MQKAVAARESEGERDCRGKETVWPASSNPRPTASLLITTADTNTWRASLRAAQLQEVVPSALSVCGTVTVP